MPGGVMKKGRATMSDQQMSQKKLKETGNPAYPPFIQRTNKMMKMFQGQFGAMTANRIHEFSFFFNNEMFLEGLKFRQAVWNRILENQKSWFTGIADIIQEYKELKDANTLSKHVEQECNVIGQWSALMTRQIADWAEMMENIQTDYDYWISQKKQVPDESAV
jgi:hypothetical protein